MSSGLRRAALPGKCSIRNQTLAMSVDAKLRTFACPPAAIHENRFAKVELKNRDGIFADGEMRLAIRAVCPRRADREQRIPGIPGVPARSHQRPQRHRGTDADRALRRTWDTQDSRVVLRA